MEETSIQKLLDDCEYVQLNIMCTFCDICGEQLATDYFTKNDIEFDSTFKRSIWKKYPVWKVHIVGVCKDCLEDYQSRTVIKKVIK